MATRRKVTDAGIAKAYAAVNKPELSRNEVIHLVAKRVSRSFVATARRLNKVGLVNTKTARSR